MDFEQPASKDRINGWVEDKTQGKIKNLVEEISESDITFLINAIYFRANWQYRFDPKQTQDAPFYLEDGSTATVPTMFSEGVKLRQYYDPAFRLLDIPYGNGQFSLVILSPSDDYNVAEVVDQLNIADLNRWIAESDTLTPQLYLPKFKSSFKIELSEPLKALGMRLPFSTQRDADFSRFFENQKKTSTLTA